MNRPISPSRVMEEINKFLNLETPSKIFGSTFKNGRYRSNLYPSKTQNMEESRRSEIIGDINVVSLSPKLKNQGKGNRSLLEELKKHKSTFTSKVLKTPKTRTTRSIGLSIKKESHTEKINGLRKAIKHIHDQHANMVDDYIHERLEQKPQLSPVQKDLIRIKDKVIDDYAKQISLQRDEQNLHKMDTLKMCEIRQSMKQRQKKSRFKHSTVLVDHLPDRKDKVCKFCSDPYAFYVYKQRSAFKHIVQSPPISPELIDDGEEYKNKLEVTGTSFSLGKTPNIPNSQISQSQNTRYTNKPNTAYQGTRRINKFTTLEDNTMSRDFPNVDKLNSTDILSANKKARSSCGFNRSSTSKYKHSKEILSHYNYRTNTSPDQQVAIAISRNQELSRLRQNKSTGCAGTGRERYKSMDFITGAETGREVGRLSDLGLNRPNSQISAIDRSKTDTQRQNLTIISERNRINSNSPNYSNRKIDGMIPPIPNTNLSEMESSANNTYFITQQPKSFSQIMNQSEFPKKYITKTRQRINELIKKDRSQKLGDLDFLLNTCERTDLIQKEEINRTRKIMEATGDAISMYNDTIDKVQEIDHITNGKLMLNMLKSNYDTEKLLKDEVKRSMFEYRNPSTEVSKIASRIKNMKSFKTKLVKKHITYFYKN